MSRSIKALLAATVFLATIVSPMGGADMVSAYAEGDDSYTATLSYYDAIQITYTLTYPNGGIWAGAADLPIGGAQIASQIYCVDPFIPFHSRADQTYWDANLQATVDIKHDYAVAAPWVISPALRQNYDAVVWLTLNGYRGDYLRNDAESISSVERLRQLYPTSSYPEITIIDRPIALMATKVAIWQILTGDSVVILRTSLDSSTARRASFDSLVEALAADAEAGRPTSAQFTSFHIDLEKPAYSLVDSIGNYDIYGPLYATAWEEDSAYPDPLYIDKVFLTATGPDLDNMEFVDAGYSALPFEAGTCIYGTDIEAQYLPGSAFNAGAGAGAQTSDPFYIKLPNDRSLPSSDQLTVRAYARADDVPLMAGTPVTFVYEDEYGVQDWNRVQAFIGAAKDGMTTNLYADASLNTGDTPLGAISVSKEITNASPLDMGQEFSFRLLHATNPAGPGSPVRLNEFGAAGSHPVLGAVSVSDYSFTLRNGGQVLIEGLPAGDYDYYWLEETNLPLGYTSPQHAIPVAATAVADKQDGALTSAFQFYEGSAVVSFYNTREITRAHLFVGKYALSVSSDGSPISYDLDQAFDFRLECSTDNSSWQPVDLAGIFQSDGGTCALPSDGSFTLHSMDQAFIELDPDLTYRVTELNADPRYTVMYAMWEYQDDGDGGWQVLSRSSTDDPDWLTRQPDYTVSGIAVGPDDYVYLGFENLAIELYQIELSKLVTGVGELAAWEQLFAFQIICDTPNVGLPVGQAVPLTASDSAAEAFKVEGLPAGRITNDSLGQPTVLLLKHGEKAVIQGLPAGSYRIIEARQPGYSAFYTIGTGPEIPAVNGSETHPFMLSDQAMVRFTNKIDPKPQKPRDVTPGTGDAGYLLGMGSVFMASLGVLAFIGRRRIISR